MVTYITMMICHYYLLLMLTLMLRYVAYAIAARHAADAAFRDACCLRLIIAYIFSLVLRQLRYADIFFRCFHMLDAASAACFRRYAALPCLMILQAADA